MAMESFVANGQAYFYESGQEIHLKLGTFNGDNTEDQKVAIAKIKQSSDYPFAPDKEVKLSVCGKDIQISGETDLDIYLQLNTLGNQLLW